MEGHNSSSEILRKEIREQSEAEASSILEQAEKEAEKILHDAKEEADKVKTELFKKAETQAEGIRKRILSGVHLEIKRQTLQAREKLISRLFQTVEEKLDAFRRNDAFMVSLKKLVIEGAQALDAQEIRIMPGDVEKKLLTNKVLSQVEKEILKQLGRSVKLTVSDQALPEGGVVLVTSDERMLFDNRFSARMKRMKNEMRLEAVKRVMD